MRRNNRDLLNDFVIPIFSFFIWKPIKLLWKFLSDIAEKVYGRVVMAISAVIFSYIIYLISLNIS
ncbi:hypothetical protein CL654_02985 [bacterium]|nr:hypothetical protein [bacterium]